MSKKTPWLGSMFMALSLVIAACSPAVVEEKKQTTTGAEKKPALIEEKKQESPVAEKKLESNNGNLVKVTLTKMDGTKIDKMVEKPKYGGTHTVAITSDPTVLFDDYFTSLGYSILIDGDWTRGPAGTGEAGWWGDGNMMGKAGLMRNSLAESWQIIDDQTIRFKMRQGVHFALNPASEASRLVGGREVTAYDMAWSMNWVWNEPQSRHALNMPTDKPIAYTALDKYTFELKIKPNTHGIQLLQNTGRLPVLAPEIFDKYGIKKFADMQNWKIQVGTGPYMWTDYVPGAIRTYARNPNYFEKDPWFPENRLPYMDFYKELIIPDLSTQQAAMRTGKIGLMTSVSWEDAARFKTSNPQIMQKRNATFARTLVGRMDKPGLPWGPQNDPNALKVRRALNMAINKQEMIDTYYGGNAELFAFPWPPTPEFKELYRPLSTYPGEVQELFQYNPEKAKQLLKEAGYPNGFKAIVTVTAANVDFAAILKNYLSKVGVDLVIDMRDNVVMSQLISNERTYPEMVIDINREHQGPVRMNGVRIEATWDYAFYESPVTRAAYNEANKWLMKDDAKVAEAWRSINDTYLHDVKEVMLPMPYVYYIWWPWLKRWEGASNIGTYHSVGYLDWVYIDQDLKKQMGY